MAEANSTRTWSLGLFLTRLYGPAVRCKRFPRIRADAVLHQCIRSLIGARCVLRTIMDISARAISLSDRPRPGHLGHQCSHAPGRPILHLVSSSRRPRRVNGLRHRVLLISHCSFVRAESRSFVPACAWAGALRARGRQGWPSRCRASRSGVARPRLDGPEHGARLKRVGTRSHWS